VFVGKEKRKDAGERKGGMKEPTWGYTTFKGRTRVCRRKQKKNNPQEPGEKGAGGKRYGEGHGAARLKTTLGGNSMKK